MRSVLVAIGDQHCGNKLGLCNPNVVLYDQSPDGSKVPFTPNLTESQKHVWDILLRMIEYVYYLNADEVNIISLGDVTNGITHPADNMTMSMSDQIDIAVSSFAPWFELGNIKRIRGVTGTKSHEFGDDGSAAFLTMKRLSAENPSVDISVVHHGLFEIADNVFVDAAHHGPGINAREWVKGNSARFYLRDHVLKEITRKKFPPSLFLRGHYHTPENEVVTQRVGPGEFVESRIVIIPSMCMMGGYARQITQSTYIITNGGVVFIIEDGEISKPKFIVEEVDIRTEERWLTQT